MPMHSIIQLYYIIIRSVAKWTMKLDMSCSNNVFNSVGLHM